MASKTKTWEDKFNTKKEEKIEILTKRFADAPVGSKLRRGLYCGDEEGRGKIMTSGI